MNYKKITAVFLIALVFADLSAQTTAHKKSAFAIVDPVYSVNKKMPSSNLKNDGATWIYGPGELECWRLQLLQERKDSARLRVGYPGTFHKPYSNGTFRLKLVIQKSPQSVYFRTNGDGQVFINDKTVFKFMASDSELSFVLPQDEKTSEIRFDISSSANPPALLIRKGAFSTSGKEWEWKSGLEEWQPAYHHPQTVSGVPPHLNENPEIILRPVRKENNLYDFGRELFGYILIRTLKCPKVSVGESTYEALDTLNKVAEQSTAMVQIEKGMWKSKSLLAFRYLYTNENTEDIQCRAIFQPVAYKGAFACSDSTLTRIWMNSAYTLRLCMHDFLIDGIKRDRLPWTGDLAMSMMANAYTFGDGEIIRRSLTTLGRAGIKKTDINGIIDYSLWWIISQDQFQLYFGDSSHLQQEWPRIKETLDLLSNRCDKSGFLIPGNKWLFIDWVNQEKWTALQVLWWWAQQCGIKLAHRMGDTQTELKLQKISHSLRTELEKMAWSAEKGIWLGNPEFPARMSRHANFLAVLSGLATKNQCAGINKMLTDDKISPVGTPYMAGFENMAISQNGDIQSMLLRVKKYWGGMLNQGATTFWEAYDPIQKGKDHYSFYNRPYGKSLCHAWSAGPAAFLPSEILGLRPIEDGWKRFSVNPHLGTLKWVSCTVPTPFGNIAMDVKGEDFILIIPKGTVAEWNGKTIAGPKIISEKSE